MPKYRWLHCLCCRAWRLCLFVGVFTTGPSPSTRNGTRPCPSGSFCVDGLSHRCPAGRFGCADRLSDPMCNAGAWCMREGGADGCYWWDSYCGVRQHVQDSKDIPISQHWAGPCERAVSPLRTCALVVFPCAQSVWRATSVPRVLTLDGRVRVEGRRSIPWRRRTSVPQARPPHAQLVLETTPLAATRRCASSP